MAIKHIGRDRRRLQRGVAALEAAIIMPVAIFLIFACVETYQYFRAAALLDRVAFTVANSVAMQHELFDRDQCTQSNDICVFDELAADLFQPLDYDQRGGLIISAYAATELTEGEATVSWEGAPQWQKVFKGTGPDVTEPVSRLAGAAGFPAVKAGDTVIVAEAFYDHEPFVMSARFWKSLAGTTRLYSRFFFRPRFDDLRELRTLH
ncbi:hypothetical protein G5B35_00930 [Parapusillimonas sp. SGNA-6]|nr:hypothetical protein [Parapusillimonas sp. SGNA-6]